MPLSSSKPLSRGDGGFTLWAILVALLLGLSVWFVPPYLPLLALPLVLGMVVLFTRPKWCLLATVFTLPLLTVQVSTIHLFDGLIALTLASLVWHRLTHRRMASVSVRTKLDWWLIPLACWLMFKGFTSLDHLAGPVYAVRYFFAFCTYYAVVYALRARLVDLKAILLTMFYAVLVQVAWGNLQNWTGLGYLANETWSKNERNYFAFLGLGSKSTQQAFGSFWHFAMFGHFMTASAMFFFPFLLYVVPKERKWLFGYASIFWTVVVTFSRGALSAFIAATGYFCFLLPRHNTKLVKRFQAFFILMACVVVYIMIFKNYGKTLSPRDEMWAVSGYYFQQHPEHFWFGSGIRALEVTVLNYIPKYIALENRQQFAPHNFYIMYIHYIGIFGLVFVLTGLGYILGTTYKEAYHRLKHGFHSAIQRSPIHLPYKRVVDNSVQWSQARWAWWSVNAGVHLAIFVVLFGGTNDHIFVVDTYLFTWLLLMFALLFTFPWSTDHTAWEAAFSDGSPAVTT